MTDPWKCGVGMLLSSLLVVLSRLDILLWLLEPEPTTPVIEDPDIPDRFGVPPPPPPLCDKDCSAFSKALRMSLTLTALRLFLHNMNIEQTELNIWKLNKGKSQKYLMYIK